MSQKSTPAHAQQQQQQRPQSMSEQCLASIRAYEAARDRMAQALEAARERLRQAHRAVREDHDKPIP